MVQGGKASRRLPCRLRCVSKWAMRRLPWLLITLHVGQACADGPYAEAVTSFIFLAIIVQIVCLGAAAATASSFRQSLVACALMLFSICISWTAFLFGLADKLRVRSTDPGTDLLMALCSLGVVLILPALAVEIAMLIRRRRRSPKISRVTGH